MKKTYVLFDVGCLEIVSKIDSVSFPSFQIREKWEIKGLDLLVEPILEDGVIGRLVNVNGLLSVYDFGRINTGVNDIIDI